MNKIGNIEDFLSEEFDLSQNEINLYIALLKSGHSTILELSELTGINRPTTYVSTESLMKKKFITQIKKGQGSRRSIMAEPPEKLLYILQEKKERLEQVEQQLPDIISKLHNLKKNPLKNEDMEVRYFKNRNEIRFIYEEALKAKELRSSRLRKMVFKKSILSTAYKKRGSTNSVCN